MTMQELSESYRSTCSMLWQRFKELDATDTSAMTYEQLAAHKRKKQMLRKMHRDISATSRRLKQYYKKQEGTGQWPR